MKNKFSIFLENRKAEIARQIGVTTTAVNQWRLLTSVPTIRVAYLLIAYSKNTLTFDDIYLPYLRRKYSGEKYKIRRVTDNRQLEFKF